MNVEMNWRENDRNMAISHVKNPEQLKWLDPRKEPFRISGLYWIKSNRGYSRFPDNALAMLAEKAPGVYFMSQDPAGGQIVFETNAERIVVRAVLESGQRWDHLSATGEMGMDCYVAYPGETPEFAGVTRFDARKNEYMSEILSNGGSAHKRVTIHLPLYMPLLELEIGLPEDACVRAPAPFESASPVVVYGTSITQGGCVSRPGVMYTNVLSRRLNREFLNFGFSGSGKGEPEVAELLGTVKDPAMYILEYEANAGDLLFENLKPLIAILRRTYPLTPILVCSRVFSCQSAHIPHKREALERRRAFQRQVVEELRCAGDRNIHFVDGWTLLEQDCSDCFVDGIHLSDLGARQMADALEKEIRTYLPKKHK